MSSRRFLLIITLVIGLVPAFAQSWEEIVARHDLYLIGEGWGATADEADQAALKALISQISLAVSSDFTIIEEERTSGDKLDAGGYVESRMSTYSSATLSNTERMVIDNDPDNIGIGRYIKRTELKRIFEGRIRSINEHVRLGQVAEKALKIDDALRNYYWALALLKSVQHPNEVTYPSEGSGEQLHLITWLPEHIDDLFDQIEVKIVGNDGTNIDLSFSYQNQPVSTLDFTYFDGRNWSNLCSAKNGRGTIEFTPGLVPDNIQINYEYAYRGQAHINPEIKTVLSVIKGQPFKSARVNLRTTSVAQTSEKQLEKQQRTASETKSIAPVDDEKQYRACLDEIVTAVRNKQYESVKKYFTQDGLDMFQRLIQYGNARIVNTKECTLYKFGENTVARSIQMSFHFKRGIRTNFIEDIVFTFNQDKLIDCVSFGLDQKAKEDIMNKSVWTPEARQTIIEFLETYKTAYALKRLDYLRTIFADNAVIIVGHVASTMVKTSGSDGMEQFKNSKYVRRVQYTKEEYLKNLERCFDRQEYINIRFANNDVVKAKDEEEYGIQIKQDYYSTTYGDQGYLYIQVNLDDRKQPIIKVRTWQPEPDPEIGLFDMGNW